MGPDLHTPSGARTSARPPEEALEQQARPDHRYANERERVAAHWGEQAKVSIDERKETGWLASPLVERLYIHPTISGNPDENWLIYFKKRHLPTVVPRGLNIGCGEGGLERHGAVLQLCEQYDAFDVSPGAIEMAKEAAEKSGITNVTYEVRDLNYLTLEENRYDVAFASMSLHHVENLENLFEQVRKSLKPGRLFVLNEYVGPDRFQWTPLQLIIINFLLQLLPPRLRRNLRHGRIKKIVRRPTIEEMIQIDPSEAVRSSAIVPLVGRHFRIIERIDYGGTILHMLLQDIMGNFSKERAMDLMILRTLFRLERLLIKLRILPSDFTLIVARQE